MSAEKMKKQPFRLKRQAPARWIPVFESVTEYQNATEECARAQGQHKLAPTGGVQQFTEFCHG